MCAMFTRQRSLDAIRVIKTKLMEGFRVAGASLVGVEWFGRGELPGLEFRGRVFAFKVWGVGCRVQGLRFTVHGSGITGSG